MSLLIKKILEINSLKPRGEIIYKLEFIDLFKEPISKILKDKTS
jgi:hypothetical protein